MIDQISQQVLMDYQTRTVVSVENLRWDNPEHTMLSADVLFSELEPLGPVPFTTVPDADTNHGVEIWTKAIAGDYGVIAEYVEPPVIIPQQLSTYQFGLQLITLGIKDDMDAWVATQDAATKWNYDKAPVFNRTDKLVEDGFASLNYTTEQIDTFFLGASKL